MKRKVLVAGLCLFALCFVVIPSADAAFYACVVSKVIPYANGDVAVQFTPGTGETRFTGTVRGILDADDPGANKILAVLLTACSMGLEVNVSMDDVPSWAVIQIIKAVSMVNI